jgi:glutathione peroxidase-family protein
MLAIKKDSKWLDNIGHTCTVLMVPEDQEDLTKMMQYHYQVEYQRKNEKVISRELKSLPMYRFLEDMKPINDVVNEQL